MQPPHNIQSIRKQPLINIIKAYLLTLFMLEHLFKLSLNNVEFVTYNTQTH